MKRLAILLLTLLTVVHAQTVPFDIPTAMNTAKPMMAAIQAATGLSFSVTYISGYGLSYVAQGCGSYGKDWPGQLAQIKSIATALGSTVKGLRSSDWFSLAVIYPCYAASVTYITARIPGDAIQKTELWEVWANGVRQ